MSLCFCHTPHLAQAAGRPSELQERPINTLTEQLQGCTISKLKKREQTTTTPASQARCVVLSQKRSGPAATEQKRAAVYLIDA